MSRFDEDLASLTSGMVEMTGLAARAISRASFALLNGDLELGVVSYDPGDEHLATKVIYTDSLAFVVSPQHRFARRKSVSIAELGMETFIAHNVVSPYRELVLREFRRHKVPLNMDVEMPTIETIRRLVQDNEGVAFLPRMCVEGIYAPSVSLALPPVGWHKTVPHAPQVTTV